MAVAPLGINGMCLDSPRSPEVNAQVSKFAAIPKVRQKLFAYRYSLADLARNQNTPAYNGRTRHGSTIFRGRYSFSSSPTRRHEPLAVLKKGKPTHRIRDEMIGPVSGPPSAPGEPPKLTPRTTRSKKLSKKLPITSNLNWAFALRHRLMSDSSIPNPQLYELVRTLAGWYFTTFYDYTQSGLQNVPKCGPAIFAANHVSFYDPPAIGACIQGRSTTCPRYTV